MCTQEEEIGTENDLRDWVGGKGEKRTGPMD